MDEIHSRLFNKPGYILLKEYVDDINTMRAHGPWKVPLGVMDRAHLLFLTGVVRFSWFSNSLYILHPYKWSPAYSILISYLKKKDFFDDVMELSLRYSGYFSYYFRKHVPLHGKQWEITGQGVSGVKSVALSKSLGEIIERMVTALRDENVNILIASPNEIGTRNAMVYPPKYHRFLDIQKKTYGELCQDRDTKFTWVVGVNMITGEKTYIPRQMTSWFQGARTSSKMLLGPTSNGSACYFSKDGAILRGLLEVTHRDAFMVHWLTQIPPKVIRKDTLPIKARETIRLFESRGLSLYILDTTSIPIPSVCIVAISDQSETPQIVVSAAAALTFEEAIISGLEEMMTCGGVFFTEDSGQLKEELDEPKPFISKIGKTSRQLYWKGKDKVERFEWFISGEQVSYADACKKNVPSEISESDKLKECLEVLKKLGVDYFPVIYSPKNRIPDELGLHIAQVFVPKAFPLYLLERYGTFDSDRLKEFALSRGVSHWELNPFPHMFS